MIDLVHKPMSKEILTVVFPHVIVQTVDNTTEDTTPNYLNHQAETLQAGHPSYFTSRSLHELKARGDGPLYCTDGPCVDGR